MRFERFAAIRGLALGLALVAMLALGAASTAHASAGGGQSCTPWLSGNGGGAGAAHIQCTMQNAVQQIDSTIPCGPNTGTPATVTLTVNGQMHVTFFTSGAGAGDGWGTSTETGNFVAVPVDSSLPTYTGHTTSWDGGSFNLHNFSFTGTFSIHATGSDGSSFTFHETQHTNVSASGITNSFDKPVCG